MKRVESSVRQNRFWGKIRRLFLSGQLKEARSMLERKKYMTAGEKESVTCRLFLADVCIMMKDFSAARKNIKEVIQIRNDRFTKYFEAKLLFAEENHEKGINVMKERVSDHPFSSIDHFMLGSFYEASEFYDKALSEYRWATKLESSNARFHVCCVRVFCKMEKYEVALSECEDVLRKFPRVNTELNVLMAWISKKCGKRKRAIEHLGRVMKTSSFEEENEENKTELSITQDRKETETEN